MLNPYFCTPFNGLPDSITVVRQFLVLFVVVRIHVGQQRKERKLVFALFLF